MSNIQPLTPYQLLGGESVLRQLVERFYAIMDENPDAAGIRVMHPADLSGSSDKLFMFLSGWLGGPDLFVEKFGHPRLRARHMPFAIGEVERDQWLACMYRAMEEIPMEPELRQHLEESFYKTADFMRNRPD